MSGEQVRTITQAVVIGADLKQRLEAVARLEQRDHVIASGAT